jgi:type VI secretion system protein VasJ
VKQARELTSTKSKDLLIESYAAYAMYNVEGLMGLASGVFLLAESMDRYWEGMHPPASRLRARVNAIQWLTDKLDTTLPDTQVSASDYAAVTALDAAVRRLRSVVADRFSEQAPALRPLADSVERLKMSLPEGSGPASGGESASDTEPPPPAAAPPTPAAPTPPTPPTPTASAVAPPAAAPAAPAAAPAEAPKVDHAAELAALAKPYTEPVPGGAPAGIDAKFDPEHEELRALIVALDSPMGAAVDWAKTGPRAGRLLKEKSKDLLIASYFAWGMWETANFRGLAIGLEVITQICELYWDGCFPPVARLRGRANALAWLLARLETPLPESPVKAADKAAIELLELAAKRFASVLRDKFEDAAPSVRPLLDNVQRLKMSVPEPAAPPPPKPAAAPPAAAPRPAAPAPAAAAPKPAASVALGDAPAAALADPKEVGKFAAGVSKSLLDAAKALRDAAPGDPTSYTFTRLGLALGFAVPPAQGSETKVPPPPDTVLKDIEIAIGNGAWEQVITKSELALTGKRHWLDLHRFTALAMTNLGGSFASAKSAVIAGTALWVKAFPELLELTFAGGTPFASPLTKEWIQAEVMPSGGGAGGSGDSSEGAELLSKARSLAGGGKLDEALSTLDGLANGARSGRARFRARLAMAQALSGGQTVAAAEGIFDALLEEIDAGGIERWEPELAAECYRSHLGCLKQLKKPNDPTVSQQTALVYRRLCRVDPLAALKAGA